MKKIFFSIITLSLSLSLSANATAADSIAKLKTYSAKDLTVTTILSDEAAGAKTQEMLDAIQSSVDATATSKGKINPALLKELVRVAVITFQNDPSLAAAEILLPLYKKEKKAMEEAIKSLPTAEAKELREALKEAAREEKDGNG